MRTNQTCHLTISKVLSLAGVCLLGSISTFWGFLQAKKASPSLNVSKGFCMPLRDWFSELVREIMFIPCYTTWGGSLSVIASTGVLLRWFFSVGRDLLHLISLKRLSTLLFARSCLLTVFDLQPTVHPSLPPTNIWWTNVRCNSSKGVESSPKPYHQ